MMRRADMQIAENGKLNCVVCGPGRQNDCLLAQQQSPRLDPESPYGEHHRSYENRGACSDPFLFARHRRGVRHASAGKYALNTVSVGVTITRGVLLTEKSMTRGTG